MPLARVVSFEGVNSERMAEMQSQMQADGAAGRDVPAKEILVLHDPDAEKSIVILFFENDDDYRRGDAALDAMPAGDTPGQRTWLRGTRSRTGWRGSAAGVGRGARAWPRSSGVGGGRRRGSGARRPPRPRAARCRSRARGGRGPGGRRRRAPPLRRGQRSRRAVRGRTQAESPRSAPRRRARPSPRPGRGSRSRGASPRSPPAPARA